MGSSESKHATDDVNNKAEHHQAPHLEATTVTREEPSTEATGGGCPMKRSDGSYSFDWGALFRPSFPHGPGGEKPMSEQAARDAVSSKIADSGDNQSSGGGCPVKHSKSGSTHPEYNVYSQPIDPTNNMPKVANQLPAPNQSKALSTERVASTIPKGGATADAQSTWVYPSPQMFYNALARKGKLNDDGTLEDDITNVVALHNNMNEKTWKKILQWEQVWGDTKEDPPKLLRFQGRPTDLSPKAALKHYLLGHPLPYDRHDWTILRESDGSVRRYVIDYYYDETRARDDDNSGMPALDDVHATPSLLVDVRPAADSVQAVYTRVVGMPYARRVVKSSDFEPLPLQPNELMKSQVKESVQVWQTIQQAAAGKGNAKEGDSDQSPHLTDAQARKLARDFAQVMSDCRAAQKRVTECSSEMECAQASMDLTVCMGKIVCPLQHSALTKALTESYDGDVKIEAALERLNECVMLKTREHKSAKETYPALFKKS